MAERRMFAKSIVLSDAFLDMPLSARCLYFTLGMFADDDGFVGSPKGIMRQCGASKDDLLVLIQKRFVLAFESGVIVIKHWRINNYLQNDRHKKTTYLEELYTLKTDEKGAYVEKPPEDEISDSMYTECIQPVYTGKDSIEKDRLGKRSVDDGDTGDNKTTVLFPNVFIKIPLDDKTEHDVTFDDIADYKKLYPAVNIEQQLRNMVGWCKANPDKRKSKASIKRFISSWLCREQNLATQDRGHIQRGFDANKGLIRSYSDEFLAELERESKAIRKD